MSPKIFSCIMTVTFLQIEKKKKDYFHTAANEVMKPFILLLMAFTGLESINSFNPIQAGRRGKYKKAPC